MKPDADSVVETVPHPDRDRDRDRAPDQDPPLHCAETVAVRAPPLHVGRGNETVSGKAPSLSLYGAELGRGAMVGAYVIDELRSSGGFGAVYRATGPAGEPVAVKLLHASLVANPSALLRFEQEIAVIRALRHPGVVQIHACGEMTDGRPYVVMEWLEGRTIDEIVAAHGPFDLAVALPLAEQLGAALAAVHAAGVVHRDLKGSNVMLLRTAPGAAILKVLDFGVAKRLDEDVALTRTGAPVGTPSYMAPEQILGQRVSPATDIYAFGVLLFHMLTAALPYEADTARALELLHLDAPPPRASTKGRVPEAVSEVIQRCMAKSPAERYATVEELIDDLRAAVAEPDRSAAAFRVQHVEAVGLVVRWLGGVEAERDAGSGAEALTAARHACEAEGLLTAWEEDRVFLAAVAAPRSAAGARALRARALRIALRLTRADARSGGARGLGVRVHAAGATLLIVQGAPQIVGGELLSLAEEEAAPAGSVLASEAALAGLGEAFEVAEESAGEGYRRVLGVKG